jgi:hypothetical protein
MKVRAKLFFNKARHAREKVLMNEAKSVSDALRALVIILDGTKATRADIIITQKRRLTSK